MDDIDLKVNQLTSQIAGNERKILDEYCKAFLACKSDDGMTIKEVLKNFRLEITTKYEKDSIITYARFVQIKE